MPRKTSFYYSFLVLPPEQRRAIVAVWDFCRAVDDAVDEAEVRLKADPTYEVYAGNAETRAREPKTYVGSGLSRTTGKAAIAFWREELAKCFSGQTPLTEEGRNLQPFVSRFALPRESFEDVIDGVAMDLEKTRYATFDDLLQYCRRVASAVGLICIRIFGCTQQAATTYARYLGVALQLTNILRDVKGDLERGRVYLPLDDLAACGCTVDDLAAGVATEPVRRVIAVECRRARDFYRRASEALPARDRRRLVAAEIMRAVYSEILRRIEQRDYDVFAAPVRVPRPRQAIIALRQWLWA